MAIQNFDIYIAREGPASTVSHLRAHMSCVPEDADGAVREAQAELAVAKKRLADAEAAVVSAKQKRARVPTVPTEHTPVGIWKHSGGKVTEVFVWARAFNEEMPRVLEQHFKAFRVHINEQEGGLPMQYNCLVKDKWDNFTAARTWTNVSAFFNDFTFVNLHSFTDEQLHSKAAQHLG